MEMTRAEMTAMQREQEAQRAKNQKWNLQHGQELQFTQPTEGDITLSILSTIKIKTIADLLVVFSGGPKDNFRNWK